jgi:hypothetical protein
VIYGWCSCDGSTSAGYRAAAADEGLLQEFAVNGIVNVNLVSSGFDVATSSPPCASAI